VLNDNPPNNTKYSLTEINKAIELLATGLSTHKVAAQTGISVTHVKRIRRGEARVSQQCQSVPPSISST
jgi:DNA-binding NarL/FixJ family response regulator